LGIGAFCSLAHCPWAGRPPVPGRRPIRPGQWVRRTGFRSPPPAVRSAWSRTRRLRAVCPRPPSSGIPMNLVKIIHQPCAPGGLRRLGRAPSQNPFEQRPPPGFFFKPTPAANEHDLVAGFILVKTRSDFYRPSGVHFRSRCRTRAFILAIPPPGPPGIVASKRLARRTRTWAPRGNQTDATKHPGPGHPQPDVPIIFFELGLTRHILAPQARPARPRPGRPPKITARVQLSSSKKSVFWFFFSELIRDSNANRSSPPPAPTAGFRLGPRRRGFPPRYCFGEKRGPFHPLFRLV